MELDVLDRLGVVHATAAFHQVHQDFIADADDGEFLNVAGIKLVHGLVGERTQRLENFRLVFRRRIHEQIQVGREPRVAGLDDREAAYHDVAGAEPVQFRAEPAQVRQARGARDFFSAA